MAEAKKKVEATKPTPEEKQAAAEAEVDALVARAKKALDEFENLDQKQVDRIVAKASIAALNKHLVLAKMAVDETGRGLVEDKATKNIFACEHVTNYLAGQKTVGIIRESGCGKSMMALSIMGLVPIPPGRIAGGEILYRGTDLLTLGKDAILDIRGKRIAMIFQEPMNSLNPVFTVGNQLVETLLRHEDMTRRDAWDKSVDMLKAVGIPSPEKRMHDYSFQMSGGMRQRVMIAMSLCLDPDILIADEPTTALDVTVQAQILDLLREMQDRVGASIIMITHDLGVVAEVSDKVAVMYAGRKVEEGSVEQILFNPQHPYTKALKGCIPHLQRTPTSGRHRLHEIPGMVLGMAELGKDRCSFYERCPCGKPECMEHNPPAKAIDAGHEVACWLYS